MSGIERVVPDEPAGAAVILAELCAVTGLNDIRLSLTDEGERLMLRLGPQWLTRVAVSLHLAYPSHPLEIELVSVDHDPIPPGEDLRSELGRPRVDGRASVGRLSIKPPGAVAGGELARVIHVPAEALLDAEGDFHFLAPTSRKRRLIGAAYTRIYARAPLLLDRWRQSRNSRLVRARLSLDPMDPWTRSGGTPPVESGDGPPAVWIAMHWLEAGGAESWAFQAAELARDAGYEVVISADVPAPQRLLDQALAITPHVYVPANVLAEEDWHAFFVGLLEAHNIRAIHLHHSWRGYDFLPALRHLLDDVYVLDSTHIVEHRTGGFVRRSIEMSPYIDEHHVISPELRDIYLLDADIARSKVAYHPLTSTAAPRPPPASLPPGPLRIGFLGRLAPQKRPFLFVELCRRLHRRHPGRFSFVMQGSGPLSQLTEAQIHRHGLDSVIERRPWGPAEEFLAGIDVLVICSDNEGLTLTALEAEQQGVLVLSADVGSQRTVTAPQMLVPRPPGGFLSGAERALAQLATVPTAFPEAAHGQERLVASLSTIAPSSSFLRDRLNSLKESH